MSIIQDKANQIALDMEKNRLERRLVFDPTIILTIIQVIYYLVEAYKNCNQTPKEASNSMRSGGLLERFRLRRAIRHYVNDSEMHEHIGLRMFNSMLTVASSIDEKEVKQMYEEINTPLKLTDI